ncbi:hypothetical protein GCM10007242_35560 [Pigmentiphaga litoralis]|uniref:DUF6519 domain-containing protein n=1 Tax=Pigmentiphaga litoralis TaxID=516702 RepID=UPI001673E8AC|nr:DUF6519 domain-containing protein [Pigmentiphaga litoralis]GGX24902.1 hypothetical protein GCM10007242_35560 [Pigmentiphaga litoralis]
MKGDLSRTTFDRTRHYSAVRLQQGRIVTDADWNEQADLTQHRARLTARDVIGPSGAPYDMAGFALHADTRALAVLALNDNVVWIAAEDGALLGTTNGGADWELADLDTAAHLRALATAGGRVWVVGDGGVIRASADGGLTWQAQDSGTVQSLRGVTAVDAWHAWAVGEGGLVLSTEDGGAQWQQAQSGAARLRALHFVDTVNGMAVGLNGAVLTTMDGGTSWNAVDSGTSAHLLSVARFGADTVWAAGYDGVIVRSTDGGGTWTRCDTPSASTLRAIAFADAQRGWVAGDDGAFWQTVDGGNHWVEDSLDPTAWTGVSADSQGSALPDGPAPGGSAARPSLRGISLLGDGDGSGSSGGWVVGDGGTAWRIGNGSPDSAALRLPAVNLAIAPGRYYVDGALCELDARVTYGNQADGGAGARLAPGAHLMVLHVWERHVSALQAPWIREVALGGPDTATRAQTMAQVRALPLGDASPAEWSCGSYSPEWDALMHPTPGRLAARATPQPSQRNLCDIAATAGYQRLENQLYRVEIHSGGAAPTFKWSRENGSIAYAVVGVTVDAARQQTTVRVAARGRDEGLDLSAHDRVELVDDTSERWQRAGQMFEYLADGDDENEVVLAGVPIGTLGQDLSAHPLLRRWEQRPADSAQVLPVQTGRWIELEEGVEIRFAPGQWRPGDYWQIPARTITGDVEWPRDPDTGDAVARAPEGIHDAWCRLGIVDVGPDGAVQVIANCREIFPPLTQRAQLLYGSGDGQEAAPAAVLPQPLIVRVVQGGVPAPGARVRFDVETGDGRVGRAVAASPQGLMRSYETAVDAQGEARCRWKLGDGTGRGGGLGAGPGLGTAGPAALPPGRFQRVRVSLLDGEGYERPGQAITFCATAVVDAPVREVTRRGACLTIGKGGDAERLDAAVIARALDDTGHACLCFLPGDHVVEGLEAAGTGRSRLSLHGCGPTAQIHVRGGMMLAGFAALELRDLDITFDDERGLALFKMGDVQIRGLMLARRAERGAPCLHVGDARTLHLSASTIDCPMPGVAAQLENIQGDCHVSDNTLSGILSFHGEPGGVPAAALLRRLHEGSRNTKLLANAGHLKLTTNCLALLAVAEAMSKQLMETQTVSGLFATATISGNTFSEPSNLFIAGRMVAVHHSTFLAEMPGERPPPYGVFIAERATATGNLAMLPGPEAAALLFGAARFDQAANLVAIRN